MAFFEDFDRLLKVADASDDYNNVDNLSTFLDYNDPVFTTVRGIYELRNLVDGFETNYDSAFNEMILTKAVKYPFRAIFGDRRKPSETLTNKDYYFELVKTIITSLEYQATQLDVSPDGTLGSIESENIVSGEYATIEKGAKATMEELNAIKDRVDELSKLNLSIMSKVEFLNNGIFAMLRYMSSAERMSDTQSAAIETRNQKAMVQKQKLRIASSLKDELDVIQRDELRLMEEVGESRYKSEDYEVAKSKVAKNTKRIGVLLHQLDRVEHQLRADPTESANYKYKLSTIQRKFVDVSIKPLVELENSIPQLASQWEENSHFHANQHRFISIITTALLELTKRVEMLRELTVKKRERVANDGGSSDCFRTRPTEDAHAIHCWEYGDVLAAVEVESWRTTGRCVSIQCCEKHRMEILGVYEDALYSEIYRGDEIRNWTLFLKGVWDM